MNHPNGGGFGPPGGAPPPGGGGFGPPPGGGPPASGFGTPPPGPPGGGGFGAPPPGGPGFGAPTAQAQPPVDVNVMPALVMGIFVTTMCGCLPLGVGALYMADQAKKAGARGDAAAAKSKLMISYGLSGFSLVSVFIAAALYFLLIVASQL